MHPKGFAESIGALVLPEIPKILTLLDRTAVSPTYGCFDRTYWHYRMIDSHAECRRSLYCRLRSFGQCSSYRKIPITLAPKSGN